MFTFQKCMHQNIGTGQLSVTLGFARIGPSARAINALIDTDAKVTNEGVAPWYLQIVIASLQSSIRYLIPRATPPPLPF